MVIFTSDLFLVKEHYLNGRLQTALMRDYMPGREVGKVVMQMVKRGARVCFGHDIDVLILLSKARGIWSELCTLSMVDIVVSQV